MSQHRRPTTASQPRAGGLRSVHARQQRWPGVTRAAWWVLLLPVAIAAWASCRRHVAARIAGYVLAGYVALVGVAACTADPSTPAPVAATAPAPVVATVPAPVIVPAPAPVVVPTTAAPVAPVAAPVVAPPAPSVSTAVPAPETPAWDASELGSSSSTSSSSGAGDYGDTYTNVDGNQVERPDSNSSGATAVCKDGTDSHSQHRSGTCSGHGGVARWL